MHRIDATRRLRALRWSALVGALVTALAAAVATAGSAHATPPPPAATYEIRLQYFEVLRTNEARDEVRIEFQPRTGSSSRRLWKGKNLDRGDIRDLARAGTELFRSTWDARLSVVEEDCDCFWDPDDRIGWIDVERTPGSHVATFAGDGATYELHYVVATA